VVHVRTVLQQDLTHLPHTVTKYSKLCVPETDRIAVLRILISIDLALLKPDSIGNADPVPGARKLTKINK
jgi:hypothetical protein